MAVVDIVGMNTAQHILDADRPVVVDASLFCTFQVAVAAVLHPAKGRLVVVEADGTNSTCGGTRLAGLGARRVLTQQTTASLLVDIHLLAHSSIYL